MTSLCMLQACWQEKPEQRPDFESVISSLRRLLQRLVETMKPSQVSKGVLLHMFSLQGMLCMVWGVHNIHAIDHLIESFTIVSSTLTN